MYKNYSAERQQNCVIQGFSIWDGNDENESIPEGNNEDKIFSNGIYAKFL